MGLAGPFIVYELWRFVGPGLYAHERRAILPIFYAGLVFFVFGAAVAYFFALPRALQFLYHFNRELGLELTTFATEYLGFVLALMVGFGLAFETPLVLLALMRLGLVRPETLIRQWRYAVLTSFILGAVLTPPDLPSQLILASTLILFFAGSILFAKLTFARKKKSPAPPAPEPDAPNAAEAPDDPDADPFAVYRQADDESKPEAP